MQILDQFNAEQYLKKNTLDAWRIVEDQSTSTTRKFVDSLKDHDLLERLIDNAKPNIKYYGDEKYFAGLHYLLVTPFRYPPLKWGSRFGSRFERSVLYASLDLETAMSEKAFYKFAFLKASEGHLGGKTILYTAFKIRVNSNRFLDLCNEPFHQSKNDISSKIHYDYAQSLGTKMRENEIECFQYFSARCPSEGINIGILTPRPLQENNELESTFKYLRCYFTENLIGFSLKHQEKSLQTVFPIERFMVNGRIPVPSP